MSSPTTQPSTPDNIPNINLSAFATFAFKFDHEDPEVNHSLTLFCDIMRAGARIKSSEMISSNDLDYTKFQQRLQEAIMGRPGTYRVIHWDNHMSAEITDEQSWRAVIVEMFRNQPCTKRRFVFYLKSSVCSPHSIARCFLMNPSAGKTTCCVVGSVTPAYVKIEPKIEHDGDLR